PSRRRGWRTATRGEACISVPVHGGDQALPPADPATAKTATWQPPTRLPPQESDIRRFANPRSYQPLQFDQPVLRRGLSSAQTPALNSLAYDPLTRPTRHRCLRRADYHERVLIRSKKTWRYPLWKVF